MQGRWSAGDEMNLVRYCCVVQECVICAFDFTAQVGDRTFNTPRLTPFDTFGPNSGIISYALGSVRWWYFCFGLDAPLSWRCGLICSAQHHACALLIGGMLKCWGNNNHGEVMLFSMSISWFPGWSHDPFLFRLELDQNQKQIRLLQCLVAEYCRLLSAWYDVFWHVYVQICACIQGDIASVDTSCSRCTLNTFWHSVCSIIVVLFWLEEHWNVGETTNLDKYWRLSEMKFLDDILSVQVGDSSQTNRYTPTSVVGLGSEVICTSLGYVRFCYLFSCMIFETPVTSALQYHSCALLNGGTIKCWGRNDYGQVTPVWCADVDRTHPFFRSVTGHSPHPASRQLMLCAWVALWSRSSLEGWDCRLCWRIGKSLKSFLAWFIMQFHSCALMFGGTVKCWGQNPYGEVMRICFSKYSAQIITFSDWRRFIYPSKYACRIAESWQWRNNAGTGIGKPV